MEEIIIFPYSGTGIEALDCLNEKQVCIGFVSDDENMIGKKYRNIAIYSREILGHKNFVNKKVIAVHGSPNSFQDRKRIIESLQLSEDRFTNIIHPSVQIGKEVQIGKNVLIMAGCVITSNAVIGNHICILPNSVIHHDSRIGDYTLIAANSTICGNVVIGESCYIGAASSIKNGVEIKNNVLVGIGSNVIGNIPANAVFAGNPAKSLK